MTIVYKVRLADGVAAKTDGKDIWLDDRLNAVQERCAIVHEEIHIERQHSTVQTEAVEMAVRYEAAKRLLPLDAVLGVCKDGKSLATIARELQVTRQVLMDRSATLTDEQAVMVGCLECRQCPAIAARFAGHPVARNRYTFAA